jgi:hypothetical protein
MGDSGGSSDDQNDDRNADSKDSVHSFQVETRKELESTWYCVVTKNLPTFCPCPETLWKAEFKGNGLINLEEDISMKPSTQAITWLLLVACSQVCIVRIESEKQNKGF